MNDFYKIVCLWSVLFFGFQNMHAQDLFRIGAAHDFKSDKVVHTFSLDLNRTEKVDEKKDRALFRSKKYYISPSVDINIGDGLPHQKIICWFNSHLEKFILVPKGKVPTGLKLMLPIIRQNFRHLLIPINYLLKNSGMGKSSM